MPCMQTVPSGELTPLHCHSVKIGCMPYLTSIQYRGSPHCSSPEQGPAYAAARLSGCTSIQHGR